MKKIFLILILVVVTMGLVAFFRGNIAENIPVDVDKGTVGDITVDKDTTESPVGILPFDSGVMGKVLLGPVCPVMREGDDSCNDKPYSVVIDVFSKGNDNNPFSRVESDKEGNYKVMLPPGNYILKPKNEKIFPRCEEREVAIKPSVLQEVNLSCDTGIR